MQFAAKTEQQIAEENLLAPGHYPFDVLEAHDKISKAAQERNETKPNMIHLKLRVYEDTDRGVFVDDYLMPEMAFKLRHFCDEVGLLDQYNKGDLKAEMCIGRSGMVKIGPSKPKGNFRPKDEVKDYGKPQGGTTQKQTAKVAVSASASSEDPSWLD